MHTRVSTRSMVRIISFILAIFITLSATAIMGYVTAQRYKSTIEYGYNRALGELSNHIYNLEIALEKGVYANTATQQHSLCAKLLSESNAAKSSLGELPLSYEDKESINKFIAQVGDFASYISSNISRGSGITQDEMKNFKSLRDYAKNISTELNNISSSFAYTGARIGNDYNLYQNLATNMNNTNSPDINSGFHEMNEGFTDYPTLIYDGPFSDHITQIKSKLVEDKEEISPDSARAKVSEFLGVNQNELEFTFDSSANLSLYNFSYNDINVSITKKGGYINYMTNSRPVTDEILGFDDASVKSREFLASHGMTNMKESYYVISNGVCTINYVYEADNVVYYPDLIKVGVALDNGEILTFDSTGYIMNHHDRVLPKSYMSMDQAKRSVSGMLNINSGRLVVIPTLGLSEVLCYEFNCTGENNDNVLVYINAQTSLEEQILILLKSDGGILVM